LLARADARRCPEISDPEGSFVFGDVAFFDLQCRPRKRDVIAGRTIILAVGESIDEERHGIDPQDRPGGRGASPRPCTPGLAIEGYDAEAVGYHSHLIIESGLARGPNVSNLRSPSPIAIITSLTPRGHDFAEAARDESVWAKAMDIVKEKGGSVALEVLKGLLLSLMKSKFGI
jgi:hypothetical protein